MAPLRGYCSLMGHANTAIGNAGVISRPLTKNLECLADACRQAIPQFYAAGVLVPRFHKTGALPDCSVSSLWAKPRPWRRTAAWRFFCVTEGAAYNAGRTVRIRFPLGRVFEPSAPYWRCGEGTGVLRISKPLRRSRTRVVRARYGIKSAIVRNSAQCRPSSKLSPAFAHLFGPFGSSQPTTSESPCLRRSTALPMQKAWPPSYCR